MSENSDVTIKIITEDLPTEFKLLLYSIIWSIFTVNIWIYISTLKTIKQLFNKNTRRNTQNDYNYDNLEEVTE
jgi:hypothetical protein